jgi:hypothetical protein
LWPVPARTLAGALGAAVLLAAATAPATGQVISIAPATATPDADGVVAFSVVVDDVPAPGLTSFALKLNFGGGDVVLVDGVATVLKDADVTTCSAALASGPPSVSDLGASVEVSSGLGGLFLASQGGGSIFSLANGVVVAAPNGSGGSETAEFVFGVGGATTPQTGGGALIGIRCFVGSNVPAGTSIAVTPSLYAVETAALFLDGQGVGVGNTFVAGTIQTDGAPPVNSPPVADDDLASTPEDTPVLIDVLANDDDADPADTLTITNLTQPANGVAEIVGSSVRYTPNANFFGVDSFTYTAHDGTEDSATAATVTVTVDPVNDSPVLGAIGNASVDEGQTVFVDVGASDVDGDMLVFSTQNLPAFGALTDNGNGTARLTFTPGFDDAGMYTVRVIVTDTGVPSLAVHQDFVVTVNNVNRAPQVAAIPPLQIDEGSGPIQLGVSATDPDNDLLTLTAQNLPSFAAFEDLGGGAGAFTFTPGFDHKGDYTITVQAFDGQASDTEDLFLTVRQVNRPPVLAAIGPQQTQEGVLLQFTASAVDPDAEDSLSFQFSNLPTGASVVDNGNGTAQFSWTPDAGQTGNFQVLVTAFDNGVPVMSDSEQVLVTVGAINRPPAFEALADQQVNVDDLLEFQVHASDPDAADTLTLTHSPLPTGATFTDQGGGIGTFSWTPVAGQEGNYEVTFTATDNGSPQLSGTLEISISVGNVNRPPAIGPIGDQAGSEGALVSFQVTATDPDGDNLTFFITGLPLGASFNHDGAGSAQFAWTPGFAESGVYPLIIETQDDGEPLLSDSAEITLTIGNTNRPPILANIGPQQATVGVELQISMNAADLDGDALSFSAVSADPELASAIIDDNGNGTAMFRWTPGGDGLFTVEIRVTDAGVPNLFDSEVVSIQVGAAGAPPDPPSGLTARVRLKTVTLRWSGSPTADFFTIHRQLPGEAGFTQVGTTTSYGFNNTVPVGGMVNYFVRATNGMGFADSAIVGVSVP